MSLQGLVTSPVSLRTTMRLVKRYEYKRRAWPTRTGIFASAGTFAVRAVAQVTMQASYSRAASVAASARSSPPSSTKTVS